MKPNFNEKIKKFSIASVVSISLIACQKSNFQTTTDESLNSEKDLTETMPIQCELDPVDFNIRTKVYAFELTDNTQVNFGFNILNNFFKFLGFEIKLKRGSLDLSMIVTDPADESVPLADESGQGIFKSSGTSLKVDLSQIALGFSFFHQTPLAGLTRGGLENGFDKITSRLTNLKVPWQNKVTKIADEDTLILSVGAVAGIRVGDQFSAYNVENIWQGSPCQSQLLISRKLSEIPVAVAEAIQVDANATVLRIKTRNSAERIEPGALIEIKELKKTDPKDQRTLLKSVRIVSIESEPLIINNIKVNIAEYMKNQLGPIITAKGFYLHE